jgi:hypothetical protein
VTASVIADFALVSKRPVLGNTLSLRLPATCGPASCYAAVSARVRVPGFNRTWSLHGATTTIAANGSARLSVPIPALLHRAIRAYLRHHSQYRMIVEVTVTQLLDEHVWHIGGLVLLVSAKT